MVRGHHQLLTAVCFLDHVRWCVVIIKQFQELERRELELQEPRIAFYQSSPESSPRGLGGNRKPLSLAAASS